MRRRLIVVSNRAPIRYVRDAEGSLAAARGAGGLVTALRPLAREHDVTWIASAGNAVERELAVAGARNHSLEDGSRFRLLLVAHDEDAYRLFYEVVANPTLWFVQHRLGSLLRRPLGDLGVPWADGYARVNEGFADAVLAELSRTPDAAVLFQDYHLYLAPALVRAAGAGAPLGHFVHVPWVDAADWAVLPPALARAVHEGLLACDSVGFQTERWREAFVRACEELLGRGGEALARSHANPIAVDTGEMERLAAAADVRAREAQLWADRPEALVLRVDRTDPSKNAVTGFTAFGRLLERRPDLRGRVVMLALLDPSRQSIPEYRAYRSALEREAARVNERFGEGAWTPVDLRVQDDFATSVAAFRQYDVLLVNPVLDGLNLVAKEASLANVRDGALVLSREAGAWEELAPWAIGVDPLDVDGTAAALERALELPAHERRARIEGMRAHIRAHDVVAWVAAELAALDSRSTMRP